MDIQRRRPYYVIQAEYLYRITRQDLVEALDKQGVDIQPGDVALIRTGRMKVYEDAARMVQIFE